ncbi:bifunctional UDP-N-acetylglucosamine diphosphorylase/glucosamine-1-phosphate N-acetyltransferase GlmU, partial [Candidatus Bipolaricaulota bacterium]|nr:bifunctional UDP-N-acetylglucosamine diphosphorylase/glucosamine-1-phosphate N-acetyltransferase GlmU [Candidatus Bipolaricaulota bacterium]
WIEDTSIEVGCIVRYSFIEQARIRERTTVGPYAHLRPGADVGPEARIGNFVEIKSARLARGVKAGHLAYIGDADIGEDANIGAGTITCNYDGESKHRTIIEKRAFIGSNATLVAPVTIGEGAYVAAGSAITEDVPALGLAFGRARQVNKESGRGGKEDESDDQ